MKFKITFSLLALALLFSFLLYGNVRAFHYSGSTLESIIDEIYTTVGDETETGERMTKESRVSFAPCTTSSLPFFEGFELASESKDCWTILDNNGDGNANANQFRIFNNATNAYEGSFSMYFNGQNTGKVHDDFLISPEFTLLNTEMYQLTYYYKTTASANTEFEVLLSNGGITAADFTTELQAKAAHKTPAYTKKVIYIENIGGAINIAWRVSSLGQSPLYIDKVSLVKVGCKAPEENVVVSNINKDKATFSWTDGLNSQWEYVVQDLGGGTPVGSGTLSNKPTASTDKTTGTGGSPLLPNTEYEFYVRSSCGVGMNSSWVGPIVFRTLCDTLPLPFFEGFNLGSSSTIDCWTIVDENGDSTSATNNTWSLTTTQKFQGSHSMYFSGSSTKLPHNDWLISPTFKLDSGKKYRFKYHYRTNASYQTDFKVMLAINGNSVSNFKKELLSKKKESNNNWIEETLIVDGVNGEVNVAWNVVSENNMTQLYIDNVFFEEILSCPEPIKVDSKDVKANEATIFWTDDYGKDWEYVVQKAKTGTPKSGIATKKKEEKVTKDITGNNLIHNTEYEVFVRSICEDGTFSIWSSVYVFKTECDVFVTPFFENFNTNSQTFRCWEIIDGNKDSKNAQFGPDIWFASPNAYEGGRSMGFTGTAVAGKIHNDWLISPKIKFETGKMYRLKYFYRTHTLANNEFEFEVLLSKEGADVSKFTTTVVANKKYDPSFIWKEEYVFISGVSGDVNIAWHVGLAEKATNIFIDYVNIEEVQNCPEPIALSVDNVESDEVTISWKDDMGGTTWEYVVQSEGLGIPTGNGTSTISKSNVITQDNSGVSLKNNTDYEFYVRTKCAGTNFSIWNGPFKFKTACGILTIPFWEGFNKDSKTFGCWTILDENKDATSPTGNGIWKVTEFNYQEGNRGMEFAASTNVNNDDWLISPTVYMDNSKYVLKYYYKGNYSEFYPYMNEVEVLLSNKGITPTDFTMTVASVEQYDNTVWKEKVVFFDGVAGDANIAWHIASKNGAKNYTSIKLDNITLKKVETCPEPYYVTVTTTGSSNIDIEWKQDGGVTNWEVIVVNSGEDETATPVKTVAVTTNPKTSITGLNAGKGYTIYVRAKCADGSWSDWSTAVNSGTSVGSNDNCSGAITIPVNANLECAKFVSGSLFGASVSGVISNCNPNLKNDIWFEFTATKSIHLFNVTNINAMSHTTTPPLIYINLYEGNCTGLVNIRCFSADVLRPRAILTELVVGQKYYVQLGNYDRLDGAGKIIKEQQPDFTFDLCISSLEKSPVEISESDDKYTIDELIKDVLIQTDCNLVSNVRYQNGDPNSTNNFKTLGYFNRGESDFPFEEGVVLSTNEVKYAGRPYMGYDTYRGENGRRWTGDKDINDAIDDAGGGPTADKRVTQVEFDFIPIKDSLSFEFLFASNSYHSGCTFSCSNGALFATWMEDLTTGEKQNLAKLPNNASISIQNISSASKREPASSCGDRNAEYFGDYYAINNKDITAPIDFAGVTTAIKSRTVAVVPGRKYHIKLAVMDFCPVIAHSSAVFFNAGSFDIGKLDLGEDMLVETNNALCDGETVLIQSGITTSEELVKKIEWFKDGVLIKDANGPDLEVNTSGNYEVKVSYPDLGCSSSGAVKVEIYPAISKEINQPKTITVCRFSLEDVLVDLSQVELEMFSKVDREKFKVSYHNTFADAELEENEISNVTDYSFGLTPEATAFFIRVENEVSGCHEVFTFNVAVAATEKPASRNDVKVCASYTLPELEVNQHYYTEEGAGGQEYKAGDVLDVAGEYRIYVLQRNGEDACYEEISFKVIITETVVADIFEDKELDCKVHVLEPLSKFNKYYTKSGGEGTELAVGTPIPFGQTIYVYAVSEDGLCTDESSYTISYTECPIQKGISPNGDGLNDAFDLSSHGVYDLKIYNRYGSEVYSHGRGYTNEWMGQDKNGHGLPDGTYYYVVISHGNTRTGWVQINR